MDVFPSEQAIAPHAALALEDLELDDEGIRSRVSWARRRGHPQYLWPELSFDRWERAADLIGEVTRAVIGGAGSPRLAVPPGLDLRAFGVGAFASGMGPLLGHWIQTGILTTDRDTAGLLGLHLEQGRRRYERIEQFAIHAARVLRDVHPTLTVLKGLHTARDYFPEPGTRPLGDVDILVPESVIPLAEERLRGGGFTPTTQLRTPYRRDWVRGVDRPPRSLEIEHPDSPMRLDLHGSLIRVFAGTARIDPTPAGRVDTASWGLGGEPVRVLAQPLLTAFLALHASEELHHLRLIRLVELIRVIRQDLAAGRLDWSDLAHHLAATRTLSFAYPAFALAEKLAPGTIERDLLTAAHRAAPRLMRRVVDRLAPERCLRLHRRSVAERFMWASTPREGLRCAFHVLRPTRTNSAPVGRVLAERFFRLVRGRVSVGP